MIDLALGANTFEVEVTAQDGVTKLTYTVVATRAHPELTFTSAQMEVAEGDDMRFTVTRNGTTSETTAFMLTVTPPSGSAVLVADADGVKNLTIGSGQGSVTHTVGTVGDDAWEAHADVEVTVAADAPITINGAAAHTVHVQDDDFPAAVARLSVAPNPVNEDGTNPMVTATVTITTTEHEQPHTSSGTILLSTRPDTAGAADFTALTPTTGAIAMAAGDFEEVGTDRWSHSKSVDIRITDDTDKEDDEQFTVSMAKVTTGSTPTEPPITLDSTATMRLVTISQSDRSTDNSLSALAVENGDLTPGFDAGRLEYTATVAFEHEQVTVTPTKNNEFATIKVLDGDEANEVELDDDAVADGYQVDLGVNEPRLVRIEITAEAGGDPRVHEVTITRQLPVLSISVADGTLTETEGSMAGAGVVFTVTRNGAVTGTTPFQISVGESRMMVDSLHKLSSETRIIQSLQDSFVLTVPIHQDDDWERDSIVSAELHEGAGYTTSGDLKVEKEVTDDDFPEATAVLTVNPASVDEGNPVTATVTITTDREEMPHEGAGTIQLSTADGSATAGSDYTAIPAADGALTFDITDFTEQDVGGDTRYQASAEVEIATRDDGEGEQDETFTVRMAAGTTGSSPMDSAITLGTPSSQEVTIGANQRDNDANLRGVEVTANSTDVGTFDPSFRSDVTSYAVAVPFAHSQVTLTPDTSSNEASFEFLDSSDNSLDASNPPSLQVDLAVNTPQVVKIKVTAQDDATEQTYILTITRHLPVASISVADDGSDGGRGH